EPQDGVDIAVGGRQFRYRGAADIVFPHGVAALVVDIDARHSAGERRDGGFGGAGVVGNRRVRVAVGARHEHRAADTDGGILAAGAGFGEYRLVGGEFAGAGAVDQQMNLVV